MTQVQAEIAALEERLRLAELAPDPMFFEDVLDDDVVLVDQAGHASFAKAQVVKAHQPGPAPKFTEVEISDLHIVDHSSAAVVTCRGRFVGPGGTASLAFMRVWQRQGDRWRIIAGSISH